MKELEDLTEMSLPLIVVRNKADLAEGTSFPEVKSTSRLDVVDCVNTCALSSEGVRPLMMSLERLIENLCPDDSGPCLTDVQLLR
ncbi:unnamed protein product [Strongylus vulgaris]|uniref:Uncharacterized protein n=1 Tax=Strongylus vulgaris TaxID=40348 RepID=A0A3P7JMM8_STRVU|nr:unnamed protein product [Strongylus vulgaris]